MPDSLTVSVIIPTRNRPQLLRQTVESVFQQTVLPQEIIIIDDASTDSYAEVLAQFAQAPTPVRYHRQPEAGGGNVARNAGAELATGEVLMFLDDDDTWTPDKIANQVAILKAQPEVGLVYAGRRVINEHGQELYRVKPRSSGRVYQEILERNVIGVTSSVAIRRETFQAAGGFDPEMPVRQDYDLWIRVAKISPIAYDPAITLNYLLVGQVDKRTWHRPEARLQAGKLIFAKYAADYAALPTLARRKAWASHYVLVAESYSRADSPKAYWYALRSLLQFPSLAALSHLLPRPLRVKLRGCLTK